ncbi:MAG: hypothetical protein WCK93_08800 [Nitrosomonadales bacterium]
MFASRTEDGCRYGKVERTVLQKRGGISLRQPDALISIDGAWTFSET